MTEPLGTKYARTCRRLVLEYMTARPGEWVPIADLHPLAPPGRERVNTEMGDTPFGFDDARGTVYDAGPSGEPDLHLLSDVMGVLVRDGSVEERLPRAFRLVEWLGTAGAAEKAGVKEKTWTAYVARDQAPQAGRRNPETGKSEWSAVVIGEWLGARPGPGTRTDMAQAPLSVIPQTPHYFEVPGLPGKNFWRLDRGDEGPLFTMGGVATVASQGAQVSLWFEGPDLEVTKSTWTLPAPLRPGPSHIPAALREKYAAEAREKLLACLRDGTWKGGIGY